MQKVYLDNAATTHMHEEVIDEMVKAMQFNYGNPSSTHFYGRETKGKIENVRKRIAQLTGVTSAEIIFTSGGTEANNLILRSCVEYLGIKRLISSKIEHSCVTETVHSLEKNQNIQVDYVKINNHGEIDLNHLENLLKLSEKKTLVTLMHANNEIGNINPIEKIGKLTHDYDALYHSDMVQTLGHYPINLEEIPVDFASCSAHKFHGPKGIGFAYIKKSTALKAQITGGGQERNIRSGTENVHGIIGLGKAFEIANNNFEKDMEYILSLKKYAIQELHSLFPEIHFNGLCDEENSLYTLLSISLPFSDGLIGFELDLNGIACSQGSACQSGAVKSSRVLTELLPKEFLEKSTPLRLSFSTHNTKEDIDYLISILKKIGEKHGAVKA